MDPDGIRFRAKFKNLLSVVVHTSIQSVSQFDEILREVTKNQTVLVDIHVGNSELIQELLDWMEASRVFYFIQISKLRLTASSLKSLVDLLNSKAKIIRFQLEMESLEEIADESLFEIIGQHLSNAVHLKHFSLKLGQAVISSESWISLATAIMHNRSLNQVFICLPSFDENLVPQILNLISKNPKLATFCILIGTAWESAVKLQHPALIHFNKIASHCQRILGNFMFFIFFISYIL